MTWSKSFISVGVLFLRTWLVMLFVGIVHIHIIPQLPAYGFTSVLVLVVLINLLTTRWENEE